MSIKLIVTDMDGTLLRTDNTVSKANQEAIHKAVERGIPVVIATGRMFPSALPYAKQLGLDLPIISYNGAVIKTVAGEVLYANYLKEEIVREVLDFCFAKDFYIHLYSKDVLYFNEYNEGAKGYEKLAGIKGKVVGKAGLYQHVKDVPKMLSMTKGGADQVSRVQVFEEKFPSLFCTTSNDRYAELINRGVSKLDAIERVAKCYDIKLSEVMCMGDSHNDIAMLEGAGFSVAMGNASEDIKARAKAVTATENEDGVAKAIYKYVLEA